MIYDHYFLPYAAREMAKMKTPFFSTVFNISTHFPYKLPDSLRKRFTVPGQGTEQNSMSYLDYSLRLFFNEIKNAPWYQHTLFIFSADHNIFWYQSKKATLYKRFRIPIFFHVPGQQTRSLIERPVQQLDVVPSILDILHYDRPFMAFGNSVFDTSAAGIAINRIDGLYQAIDSTHLFGYNETTEKAAYQYNFRNDPDLSLNLMGDRRPGADSGLQQHLKAVLQCFNYSMIHNKLYIK